MAKEVAFGPNHLKAHHPHSQRRILISFKSASKKTKSRPCERKEERWKGKDGEEERSGLPQHSSPSVLKAWLRSLVMEYVDEEERKNGSKGDRRKE